MRDVALDKADHDGASPLGGARPSSSLDRVIGAVVETLVMALLALVSFWTRLRPPSNG